MVRSTTDMPDREAPEQSERGKSPDADRDADKGSRSAGGREDGHRPHRRRRRLLRVAIVLLVLLAIVVVAVQLVLWSNIPRNLVLAQLQSQLGLRVTCESLSTGWLGNTRLRNVTLGLPMAEQAFLDMPRMEVKHTSLFGLILRRPVSVQRIVLENPTLYVRRDSAGRWNLAQVTELVSKAGGQKPAEESSNQGRPKLPEVRLTDGTVVVQDYGGAETKIRPLNLHGRPDPQVPMLIWRYDLHVPDHVKLVGFVAPGAPWGHEVNVAVENVHEWAKPWAANFPQDAKFVARWSGKTTDAGGVVGRLELADVKAAGVGAKGIVGVETSGGAIAFNPDGLMITTQQKALPEARLLSGRITSDGGTLRAERLYVAVMNGQVRLDGNYALGTQSGQLDAEWRELATGGVTHGGTLKGEITAPFPQRPELNATIVSRGVSPDGPWDATLELNGRGLNGWGQANWTLKAPQLDWRGNYPLELDGLNAQVETRNDPKAGGNVVRLVNLNVPKNRVESIGEYNLTNGNWKFWVNVGAVNLPGGATAAAGTGTGEGQAAPPLTVMLNAWGNPEKIRVEQFFVRGAEAELFGDGWYVKRQPSPLDLIVHLKHIPPRRDEEDRPPVFGFLKGEARIRGTAFNPRSLTIEGKLNGENVSLYGRTVGDVEAKLSGKADNEQAFVRTDKLKFLEGFWALDAVYARKTKAVTVGVSVEDLDLKHVGALAQKHSAKELTSARRDEPQVDFLSGVFRGKWQVVLPGADLEQIKAEGNFEINDLRAPGFSADSVAATTTMANGTITVGPVKMARALKRTVDGIVVEATGGMTATVKVDADDFSQVIFSLDVKNWPFELGGSGWADVTGGTAGKDLVIDLTADRTETQKVLPGRSAVGELIFESKVTYDGRSIGDARLLATLLGREIDLRELRVNTLDGNLRGQGVIELEKPLEARSFFVWEDVKATRLVDLFPSLKGLQGTFSGTARVQPSKDPRALGPLAFDLQLDAKDARYNALQIGKTVLLGYADLNRIVLNDPADLASQMEVAGGVLTLWGRVSYHNLETTKDAVSSQFVIDFKGLDLNQIIKASDPDATDTPGRLDGSLTLIGATRGPRIIPRPAGVPPAPFVEKLVTAFTADGSVKLSEAKLGRLPVFSELYTLMSLGQDVKENNGRGDVQVHLENGTLELNNLSYFNRGTEVRIAQLAFERVWEMPNSPIRGRAFGSLRPLASLNLPFIAEADRLIALLTADLLAVGVKGTADDPQVSQLGLDELGADLKAILFGNTQPSTSSRGG